MFGVTVNEDNADHVVKWLKKSYRPVRADGGAERIPHGVRYWSDSERWSEKYGTNVSNIRMTFSWGETLTSIEESF